MHKFSPDVSDLLFRVLFCVIFVGLGAEHLYDDRLIQHLMPTWVPMPRLASMLCGAWLLFWGLFILLGWHLRFAAIALGFFLILVTASVHVPGVFSIPARLPEDHHWMWTILQRTNLVKNICLLGVCFHLMKHQPGRYSLAFFLNARKSGES